MSPFFIIKMQIKPSLAFTKALEELIYHQKLLSSPQEVEKLLAESRAKKPVKKLSLISLPTLAKSTNAQPVVEKVSESISKPTKRKSDISGMWLFIYYCFFKF